MTKQEFKLTTAFTPFQKACLTNEYHGGEQFMAHWRKSKSIDDFLKRVREDESLKYKHGTAELFKDNWYFLREQLGEKSKKTYSDRGSLKIGVDDFSILIPNGYGDGVMRYAVFEDSERINLHAFRFLTCLEGKNIKIYDYDCGNDVVEVISGEYGIYAANGFVVFAR